MLYGLAASKGAYSALIKSATYPDIEKVEFNDLTVSQSSINHWRDMVREKVTVEAVAEF